MNHQAMEDAVLKEMSFGRWRLKVIDELLDIDMTPRKPQYLIAPEIPLVLQSCEFKDLKFICSPDAKEALRSHLESECQNYKLQAEIFHEALLSSSSVKIDESKINNITWNVGASHAPLMSRPTESSYGERRVKLDSRS